MSRTQKLKGLVAASLILKTLNDNPYISPRQTKGLRDRHQHKMSTSAYCIFDKEEQYTSLNQKN